MRPLMLTPVPMAALLVLTVTALTAAGAAKAACTDRTGLTEPQIDEAFATLRSEASEPLARIRAYNRLCTSDDAAVRGLADEAALASGSRPLQAALLPRFLLDRQRLILMPYDNGDLTEAQREWIEGNPPISFPFVHIDREASCIGLVQERCHPTYVLDYSGTGVSIAYGNAVGELSLTEAGVLEGVFTPSGTALRVPVRARLR